VYLIGVDHRFQRVGTLGLPPEVTVEFASTLKDLVRDYQIRGIAEEMSLDGLWRYRAGGSLPFRVARELGLPHRYCDPSREAQQQLSITSDAERERCWLTELETFTADPCLFVLGATHTASFSSLLNEAGFTATVLFDDWLPSAPLEEV
jgi:hypothetical protein